MAQLLLNILGFISFLLTLYIYVIIAYAVVSWLIAFNVVNTRNQFVHMLVEFLYRITEPALRPIRNVLPNFGGFDLSPIVLWLIILFIQMVILPFIASLIAS
jgi:YggT family protein